MRPPEGERLDDAMALVLDHSWREHMPALSAEQLAELLEVVAPWFREELAPRRKPVAPKASPPKRRRQPGEVTSSRVPQRIRDAVLRRDGYCCQRCGAGLRVAEGDYSLQHRDNRGMGGSKLLHTLENLVALCGSATTLCHGHVEANQTESYREGWSVPNGADPEDWPVYRFQRSWEQPGQGWEKTVPHERQREMWEVA